MDYFFAVSCSSSSEAARLRHHRHGAVTSLLEVVWDGSSGFVDHRTRRE